MTTIPLFLLLFCYSSALLSLPVITAAYPVPSLAQLLAEADAAAAQLSATAIAAGPLPPSFDPWYRAPLAYDWRQTDPGSVLKVRQEPLLNRTVGHAQVAYQLLYRTTDSRYDSSWAVTTLLVPRSFSLSPASTSKNATAAALSISVLSYQLPYDTCNVDASPSFALHFGEPYGEIAAALWRGWLVAVPDYEGPLASYAAGVQAGHATLDGVRAALAVAVSADVDGVAAARVALWGYSGGALASEWAAELAEEYAPKLAIAGVALGGLTPNVTSVTAYLNKQEGAGLIPQGLLGIATQHPDAYVWIVSRLKPALRDVFLSAKRMTGLQSILAFQYQDIYGYFIGGYEDLHTPVMQNMYNVDGYMGYHGVPRMPVFVYNAVHDELSNIMDVDALVDRFCGVGANILYHRNMAGTHNQEIVNGRQRAFAWLRSVLDGTYGQLYPPMGCTIQNVTYNLAPWVGWG
ncbi:hypothetical protein C7999DRAFT_10883 [Corynascus novoguineensis]|uniref:Triacylglycerol lipase n=1 Tax=Corynascus novoguineensis TaxID=1126955 RepID=A0AAN7D0H4_9PEZI|nr:hypothetical protein C7999DRAFT_10883 [Corynascus novoguineensis]